MKKRLFQLFVMTSFIVFVFANYSAFTSTVKNSDTSEVKLLKNSFAQSEWNLYCYFCGQSDECCTCSINIIGCQDDEYEYCNHKLCSDGYYCWETFCVQGSTDCTPDGCDC